MKDHLAFLTVRIDCTKLVDWASFHQLFKETMGFPDFYGNNLDAWIDCMTHLDDPLAGMTRIHAPNNGVVVLELLKVKPFSNRCPEIFNSLVECSAFVNWRRLEKKSTPILIVAFND